MGTRQLLRRERSEQFPDRHHATLLADSEIGEFCLVAAGAVVKEGARVPPYSFVAGVPAQVRPLKKRDRRPPKNRQRALHLHDPKVQGGVEVGDAALLNSLDPVTIRVASE